MKRTDATSSPLANKLMEYARADGVLAIRGLQAALIDAAIALDNYVAAARSERAPSELIQAVREDALEEAAKVADGVWISSNSLCRSKCGGDIAKAIRALKGHPIVDGDLATQREIADKTAMFGHLNLGSCGSAPSATRTPAEIVAAIVDDLQGRKGIGDEWHQVDDEIQKEIIAEWEGFFK